MGQNPKKLKILYVITQGQMGGAQRYVFDLATNLDKRRYEIAAAIGAEQDMLSTALGDKGCKVFKVHNLVRNIHPLKDLAAIFELKKIIRKINPDIVHLNSSKAGVLGSIAGWLCGKKIVFTAHGFAFLEPNNFLVRQIYFWAEKIASLFRDKIITVSEFDKKNAIAYKLSRPEKLVMIHNGIANSVIPSASGQALRYSEGSHEILRPEYRAQNDNRVVIGTIAHDYPTKDLKTLRNAFEIVKKEYPNAELKILSGVPNGSSALESFDIYACSSVKEGFPYTILEAMQAGLPIVSTDVGGIPEMLTPHLASPTQGGGNFPPPGGEGLREGGAGILVPPRNPEALAEGIKKLISDPELAERLGMAAQKKVQEFSLDKMIRETEGIYKSRTFQRGFKPR